MSQNIYTDTTNQPLSHTYTNEHDYLRDMATKKFNIQFWDHQSKIYHWSQNIHILTRPTMPHEHINGHDHLRDWVTKMLKCLVLGSQASEYSHLSLLVKFQIPTDPLW